MPSGIGGYAALNARVRVKYAALLTPAQLNELSETADFPALINALKRTDYGPYLEDVKDKDLTPRRATFEIKRRLADAYNSIILTAPQNTRPLLTEMFRFFEVDNLKAILRGIVLDASWDRIRYVFFPLGTLSILPAQAMVEAGSIGAAVELLRGTEYYETLTHAMRRYTAEQNLFPLEVALDLFYWRRLWEQIALLQGEDRTQAVKIIGALVDMNNLMWAIRYKVYHNLSEEELINYTLPFGYRVKDEDIRGIAAGVDLAQIVERVYPELPDVEEILRDARKGLPQLEVLLQRRLAHQCNAAFVGNPFLIGIPLAYLILSQLEIQDLTVLMEAKATGVPADEFRNLLVGSAARV